MGCLTVSLYVLMLIHSMILRTSLFCIGLSFAFTRLLLPTLYKCTRSSVTQWPIRITERAQLFTIKFKCFYHSLHSLWWYSTIYCMLVRKKWTRQKLILLSEAHCTMGGWQQTNPDEYILCGSKYLKRQKQWEGGERCRQVQFYISMTMSMLKPV